ncbi:hypothetical protein [Cryptosporangium arvum]|uniref:hypothetical protein n=1 Tax=Cryptosporangium arvum TaxID=80871 RepID=UPI0004AF9457|nr:hypothetical protein [Cryptosporangium arvum]
MAPLWVGLAVLVVLVVAGAAVFFATSGDAGASAADNGKRRSAAELARKGLNCMQTTPVTQGVAPAQERVKCQTGGGGDAVISTFDSASAARKDAEQAFAKLSSTAKKDRGLVFGSYWTVSCSFRQVCEGARDYLDGEMMSD